VEGKKRVILWDPKTKSASAYSPVAWAPGKYTAPRPNSDGISPQDKQPDAPLHPVTLALDRQNAAAPFVDKETKSRWDVAGRAVEGELKDWTLAWLDSTQVKWFAWAAEYPMTTIYQDKKPTSGKQKVGDAIREIAGSAEFLRNVPKKFATVKSI